MLAGLWKEKIAIFLYPVYESCSLIQKAACGIAGYVALWQVAVYGLSGMLLESDPSWLAQPTPLVGLRVYHYDVHYLAFVITT